MSWSESLSWKFDSCSRSILLLQLKFTAEPFVWSNSSEKIFDRALKELSIDIKIYQIRWKWARHFHWNVEPSGGRIFARFHPFFLVDEK